MPKTIWKDARYDASTYGTKLLQKILNEPNTFDYPKSVWAVYDALLILLKQKDYAVVLDFFAGSGTTGHALLELDKQLGGNRSFILCTNNEGNICSDVCYPRIKKVIEGYTTPNNEKIDGLKGNLKYFRTDFVESEQTDKNKRKLVDKCTEMLCIKENAFELVKDSEKWKIFKNNEYYLGIIFDDEYINYFIKEAENIDGAIHVYIFSQDDSIPTKEFKKIKDRIILKPIPETILKVYRMVLKNDN